MKLRVLHVLASPHLGGAEQMCLALAVEHRKCGHDVSLLLFRDGRVAARAGELGIPHTISNNYNTINSSKARQRRAAQLSLKEAVAGQQPHIVHSHVPLTNLICSRALPELKVPWVATIHGSWKQFGYASATVGRPWLRPYLLLRHAAGDRITTSSAAGIAAPSEYVRKQLMAIGISSARITTILNGIAPPPAVQDPALLRRQLGVSENTVLVGALGYFAPVKGFDLLIRAACYLRALKQPVHFVIAGGDVLGDGSYRKRLTRLISELGASQYVTLMNAIESSSFLSGIDIFCVSSRTEGLPLVLLEAMFGGKPSIVTSEGGCLEAARPDMESLVFRSGDPRSLAEKLKILAVDNRLRETMGQAAAARASTRLTIMRCAAEYEQFYAKVLKARAASMQS